MPEHDLQPPRFSRQALERILNDWTAVRAMLLSGRRPRRNSSPDVIYEEQLYLESQSGTARLDKFTHCLLVKCSVEVSQYSLSFEHHCQKGLPQPGPEIIKLFSCSTQLHMKF